MKYRVVEKSKAHYDEDEGIEFDELVDAISYIGDLQCRIYLQQVDDNGNIIEQWEKNLEYYN